MSIAVERIRSGPFPAELSSSRRPRIIIDKPTIKPATDDQFCSGMETSSPTSSPAGPMLRDGSDGDIIMENTAGTEDPISATSTMSPISLAAAAAAASAQQPKVVQTAFIHKLYK